MASAVAGDGSDGDRFRRSRQPDQPKLRTCRLRHRFMCLMRIPIANSRIYLQATLNYVPAVSSDSFFFAPLHQCIQPLIGTCCAPGHYGYQRAFEMTSTSSPRRSLPSRRPELFQSCFSLRATRSCGRYSRYPAQLPVYATLKPKDSLDRPGTGRFLD